MRARRHAAVLLLAAVLALGASLAAPRADDEGDDGFGRAIAAGEAVPLEKLLAVIRQRFAGRILKVEVERETIDGRRRWVYEAKLLTPGGIVLKLIYDARSLALLKQKGRSGKRGGDDD